MTTEKLNQLFDAALDNEIKVADLEGITKDKIYNWRKGRNTHKVSTGDKLNLLWQLNKIDIDYKKQIKSVVGNWKNAKIEEPNFDNVNYMVILQLGDSFFYGSAYWDGKIWLYETVKNSHVVAFTATNPKIIIDSLT